MVSMMIEKSEGFQAFRNRSRVYWGLFRSAAYPSLPCLLTQSIPEEDLENIDAFAERLKDQLFDMSPSAPVDEPIAAFYERTEREQECTKAFNQWISKRVPPTNPRKIYKTIVFEYMDNGTIDLTKQHSVKVRYVS